MECCLRIKGRVQGVGFRRWAVHKAREIDGLSGYIFNNHDGDVLTLLSGTEEVVNKMRELLYKGPFFSRVDSVETDSESKVYFPPVEIGVFKKI